MNNPESIMVRRETGEVMLSSSEVELVKKTVANGATDDELRLFLHDCRRQGVHPLDKLIHFTKRGGRYTPITSIDFMRMRAADTGELAGNDDPVYSFKEGEASIPASASVTVHRLTQGQRFAYTATARWVEYKPPSGQDHMWLKMPQLMLGKCAEALALRKAFPKQLHGIYESAELAQAGRPDEATRPVAIEAAPDEATELFPTAADDERKALVHRLHKRWIDLALTKAQAKAILSKHGLPEVLASSKGADWSNIDLAVIRDLVSEAGA